MHDVEHGQPNLFEQARPYWLDIFDLGSFEKGLELFGLFDISGDAEPADDLSLTVTSISSSPRIRAAYETASSA